MTEIPSLRTMTAEAIDRWYEASQFHEDSPTLRCSSMGNSCDRALWYALRWAFHPAKRDAKSLRKMENGKTRERVILDALRGAGLSICEIDEETGVQIRAVLASGHLTGSVDGVATDVPDAPKTPHLVEIKTMNAAHWKTWRRKGVAASHPVYHAQVQLYMRGLGLTRCLFVAENQDTRDIEVERLHYDPVIAARLESRAVNITRADAPPARISDDPDWYECRMCPAHLICHGGAFARRNCRTCLAVTGPSDKGNWRCDRHNHDLALADQRAGCSVHLYAPHFVTGEQVDADMDRLTVAYRLMDGSLWIDGGVNG